MSDSWKKTVTNVSDKIFPGLMYSESFTNSKFNKIGHQIVANLPLQMSLYLNVIFFPFWLATVIAMLIVKYDYLSPMYRFILVTMIIVVSVVECFRLYLGYLGNLKEKIPELAAFWMISGLVSFPLQVFPIAKKNLLTQPAEIGVQIVMLVLLIVQSISGFVALRNVAKCLAEKYQESQTELYSERRD